MEELSFTFIYLSTEGELVERQASIDGGSLQAMDYAHEQFASKAKEGTWVYVIRAAWPHPSLTKVRANPHDAE